MDTNTVRNEVSKDVTLQRRALFGLILVALLVGLGLAGGIKGCELQKQVPVAKPAVHHEVPVAPDPAPLPLLAVAPLAAAPVVRAKFRLVEKREHCDTQGATLVFSPVTSGYEDIEEDKRFHRYTPSGRLEMFVNNPPAVDKFALGGKYYIDFTPADVPIVPPGDPANILGVNHG